jgi:protein TonB
MKNCDGVCETTVTPPLAPASLERRSPLASDRQDSARFVVALTFVLWLGCSTIGVLGFTMPYLRPQAPKPEPLPMQVEMLNVELSNEPLPDLLPPVARSLELPPPAEAVAQPTLPPAVAVALPSSTVAFAVPVAGPARIVEVAQASYSSSATRNDAAVPATPPVQALTFGQGAGRQPAPEYPWRAQSEGQEGVVNVRFTVAENGRVAAAEAVSASPWPLLNESAVRTVRSRWRFPAGTSRAYEVAIRFVLPK